MRWLLLLALSCGAGPDCVTLCGLRFYGGWECSDLRSAETKIVSAFHAVNDDRFKNACGQLAGWAVEVASTPSWRQNGIEVSGTAFCDSITVRVGSEAPLRGALAHELAHAVQRCEPRPDPQSTDPSHANWTADGIFEALAKVRE